MNTQTTQAAPQQPKTKSMKQLEADVKAHRERIADLERQKADAEIDAKKEAAAFAETCRAEHHLNKLSLEARAAKLEREIEAARQESAPAERALNTAKRAEAERAANPESARERITAAKDDCVSNIEAALCDVIMAYQELVDHNGKRCRALYHLGGVPTYLQEREIDEDLHARLADIDETLRPIAGQLIAIARKRVGL